MINISQLAANKGQIEVYDVTEEEQAALSSVIDKAYDLMEELDAYEE